MHETEEAITRELSGLIFEKLQDAEFGEIPYKEHRVQFKAGKRNENNQPKEAYIEVLDQEGYRVELYNLNFDHQDQESGN